MKTLSCPLATLTLAALMVGFVGCGGDTAPAESPAKIEEAQKEAKQRIQREYGQSSKKAANIK
ncbi:hypothetical protein EP7_004601 [Isosphaeraceae bacterium EP7]